MTCIVGIEHEGHVYLGGDSAGVAGLDIRVRTDEKVFHNEGFIMGFTTSFRMGQILRYSFDPPEQSSKQEDNMAFIVTDVVDGIRSCFKEKGFMNSASEGPKGGPKAEEGGQFLLGYKGKLYQIESDFQVGTVAEGYDAVGCGTDYALGSLYSTRDMSDPLKRLELALQAAAHFSGGVRPPFKYVSTKAEGYIEP